MSIGIIVATDEELIEKNGVFAELVKKQRLDV